MALTNQSGGFGRMDNTERFYVNFVYYYDQYVHAIRIPVLLVQFILLVVLVITMLAVLVGLGRFSKSLRRYIFMFLTYWPVFQIYYGVSVAIVLLVPYIWAYQGDVDLSAILAVIIATMFAWWQERDFSFMTMHQKLKTRRLHHNRLAQIIGLALSKEYFIDVQPDVWFDMAAYIFESNDGVRSYQEKHRWLKQFTDQNTRKDRSQNPQSFQGARVEFGLRPGELVEHIEKLSQLLISRDLCIRLLEYFGEEKDKRERERKLQGWMHILNEIFAILQLSSPSGVGTTDDKSKDDFKSLDRVSRSFASMAKIGEDRQHSLIEDHLSQFLARAVSDKEFEGKRTIKNASRENRQVLLGNLFRCSTDSVLLEEIQDLLKVWLEDSTLLSLENEIFHRNVCWFVTTVTGRNDLQYQQAIQILRETSYVKYEQSKVLYEAVERQQVEISLLQQIIACLEYRHILEQLPNKASNLKNSPSSSDGHGEAWKKTWKLAVECELEKMIGEYLGIPALKAEPVSESEAVTEQTSDVDLPSIVTVSQPLTKASPLRILLQWDFNVWAKRSTKLQKANKVVGTLTDDTPTDGSPTDDTTTDKPPIDDDPTAITLMNDNSTDGSSRDDVPIAATLTQDTPTDNAPTGDAPPAVTHIADIPAATSPADNTMNVSNTDHLDYMDGNIILSTIIPYSVVPNSVGTQNGNITSSTKNQSHKNHNVTSTVQTTTNQVFQTTGNFKLVDEYRPNYKNWQSFQRGDGMYHELSGNIHAYGKSFDAHEANFSKSDRLIFDWLNPFSNCAISERKEVRWVEEWERRIPTEITSMGSENE